MSQDRSPPVAIGVERGSALWDRFPEAEAVIASAVLAIFDEAKLSARPDAELAILLSDDYYVRELNSKWRGKNTATNVLTFPAFEPEELEDAPMLGDIVLAFETIDREASDEAKSVTDHLSHLVIHGVLHIFGYDHLDDDEAEDMEAIETRALARLGVAAPYADHPERQHAPETA